MLIGEPILLFLLSFQQGSSLQVKNLLLQEQILSFKRRVHVKELHHRMKQTKIHVIKYNIILGKEAKGCLIEQEPLLGLTYPNVLKYWDT